MLYADAAMRAPAAVLALNRQGQSGLWRFAISGDLPIMLLGVADLAQVDMARQLVQAHAYWRRQGLAADLVILLAADTAQASRLRAAVLHTIAASGQADLIDKPGGVFVLAAEGVGEEGRVLLQSVARIVLDARDGPLDKQLESRRARAGKTVPARQTAAASPASPASPQAPLQALRELAFDNGFGGFTPDGREYVITSSAARMTPLPWINVLANPSFGTLVSESGSASTWSENAQQFRLTPWSNDPVSDANTEAYYIRDEDSGRFWSPTLLPAPSAQGSAAPYVTRHGFGYSVFEHLADGIASELTMFVAIGAPIKFVLLELRNDSKRPRRLSVTGYLEWVLGDERVKTAMHVGTEVDAASGAMFARNPTNTDFTGRTAFFAADAEGSDPAAFGMCGDRRAFIGPCGSLRQPDAMTRPQLCGTVGLALDPCAAIRLAVELAVGQTRVLVFRIGAGTTTDEARQLVQRWRGPAAALGALAAVKQYWTHTLGAVQVQTPDRSLDILANGWLLYQTLSCRLWARTAFYQASGAYGFRDQLQDVMALVHAAPALVREHLLRSAARQFPEGDVQHWWHPPSGRGVRTRCSDDFLWLPLAAARYVQVTGDTGVLDEPVHFVEGPALKDGEVSDYGLPAPSLAAQPLYEHCRLAIEHGLRFGAHGLPLMGSGDWNDGMNLVGVEGKGESVWLGFFLCCVLTQFGELARRRTDDAFASRCSTESARLAAAIEASAWDGAWYRRAWFDDGSPLGTAGNAECRIDSIAQSWAVLSGAGAAARSRLAMDALDRMLVDRDAALIRLLAPPFDHSDPSPGYIQGYVRGVRENGGQYTHAAVWAATAFAALGDRPRAWELFGMLNPVQHAKSAHAIDIYKAEPYVLAGDVYALPPHAGRGGWSWYTGSAGWLYRFILESLLGLQVEADTLRLHPCLPPQWEGCTLSYRRRATLYRIQVLATATDAASPEWTVDGSPCEGTDLQLIDDGKEHSVVFRVRDR
jgi:cellobiose phosphorylase